MKTTSILIPFGLAALVLTAGCDRNRAAHVAGIEQTKFPGQVTAGGGTSGEILEKNKPPTTDATYAGGTPGIAGGSGGTTGGAATAGTVQETGQGPDKGVTKPTGTGQGTQVPSGDNPPPAPPPANQPTGPASNTAPKGPAAPGTMGSK
ncbi:hypothetical protein [Massilia sp. AB1]|uniref:hypothetical protein n=1 Tax=Massilia sp. AB1 TaxID=2823371 RepID=UPI001B827C39|nr:hypothetical protein [Massilia sp. AB1]MBQ5939421.1 hypothetical protein [Massilia sp. AB1]